MTSSNPSRPPPGETSGSSQRAPQRLAAPALSFDLTVEANLLRAEQAWRDGDRNANSLVHEPDFRIVLTALRAGARLAEHGAEGRVSIHTLSGRLRLTLPDQTVDLPAGHILALEPGIRHDVEAVEESTFLLTIAWPPGRQRR